MHRVVPVTLALSLRDGGRSWKEVANELEKLGYSRFHGESVRAACARAFSKERIRLERPKPVELIRALRDEGVPWKLIGDKLHSMGYPRWHYSTLANVLAGRHK